MIVEKFEKQVNKNPDHIAIKTFDDEISYKILNNQANVLARKIINDYNIINQGDKKKIVAILCEHGKDMIIGTIGALKAQTIYVPLDPRYPIRRLTYMLENSEADFIVTNNNNIELASYLIEEAKKEIKTINIEQFVEEYSTENIVHKISCDDIAYILYTSGSTGNPKGIIQTHRNVLHFIDCYKNTLAISKEDRMTLFSSFSHDAAVMDIYGALLNGATLYPLDIKSHKGIDEIGNWLETERITIWHSVPTVYRSFVNLLTGKEKFETLRFIVLGGENVILHDIEMFQKLFTNAKLVNLYGQTESSFNSAQIFSLDSKIKRITLGKSVHGTEIIVVDENREEVSPLNIGEIVILSDYVALGYLKDEEKSREVFQYIPDVGKTYWSGDLGKLLPDGNIEFIGRKDSQVKIRGYRVEVEEIENCLLRNEAVKETVVLGRKNEDGYDYLCAYIVLDKEATLGGLKEYLSNILPDYMIPSYIVQLEKMPLTPNGKVERKALPDPQNMNIATIKEYEAPSNELEKRIASIWSEVLGVDKVGINDSFFDLGGHSLKATLLKSKIYKELNIKVPFREIFNHPTIKEISRYIERTDKISYLSIGKAKKKEYYEASSAQKRMYLLQQFDIKGIGYNMPGVIVVEGEINKHRLEESFLLLINRHEALRTSLEVINDTIVQRIHENINFEIEWFNKNSKKYIYTTIDDIIRSFVRTFDLSKAPLLRVGLIQIEECKNILMFDMHHIISDGVSMGILMDEFTKIYDGNELDELKIQYKDYSEWQNDFLNSEEMNNQKEYWINRFSDEIPVLNIPADFQRPLIQSFEGNNISFKLDKGLTDSLKKIAKKTGSTMYMVLLAAINILLSKYSGQEDIIVGSPIAGRPNADLDKVIGVFVNTLAMRNYPNGKMSYEDFLMEVKENALKAYENQDYQFDDLVDNLKIARDMSRNPIFDVMFKIQNYDTDNDFLENISIKAYRQEKKTAKFDLEFYANELEEEILFNFEYSTKLYKRETIEKLKEHFLNILKVVSTDVKIKLNEIDILTEEEKNKSLYEFNDTYVEFPRDKTIHELFELQVEKTPNNIAVIFEDKQLTYKDLNEKANSLARILRKKGVKEDTVVGIMIDRSLEMIVGIMGILKAGGAYLPIDPGHPKERIMYMLGDSKTKILLGKSSFIENIEFNGVIIDLVKDDISDRDISNLLKINTSNSLAYVIYTSGTTGNPKGVMIEHKALVNRLLWMQDKYPLTEEDTILQKTTYTFDVSVWELLWWSLVGAKVCMLSPDCEKEPVKIVEAINKYRVSTMHFVPSMLDIFLHYIEENNKSSDLDSLRQVFSSGEALNFKQVSKFYSEFGDSKKLINLYGPTEAAIDVTYFDTKSGSDVKVIPIGKPISNIKLYILDSNRRLQPIGVAGELYIAGIGLARGYLNKLELTKEKFVDNPFEPGTKVYKTGDLTRWLPNGNIEFLGRLDTQVKIRGFRIELGEIENKLLQHEEVKEAVVIVVEGSNEVKYICAYIVSGKELDELNLKDYLEKSLPVYMVPSYFVKLEKMPLTLNGKLDRNSIPKPNRSIVMETEYEEARNDIEAKLVEIWKQLLDMERIGINDNFFELGGHSLNAVMLCGRIYKEFNIEIPLKVLFKIPTIKELYKCCINKELFSEYKDYSENQVVTRLNDITNKNIFLFPPTLGFGIVYREIAKYVKNHTVYSFDFIEDEHRIAEYAKQIINIYKDGKIILMGHSAGGNLAFEVAKELENRGYDVCDLILLDSEPRNEKISLTSENFTVFDNVINNVRANLDIPFIVEYVNENLQRKLEAFIPYWNGLINNGNINANIHFISCSNENIYKDILENKLNKTSTWEHLTKKSFKIYQGYGEHGEMVDGNFAKLNAQIINKIINNIIVI